MDRHELCALFPLMAPDVFASLRASIARDGLLLETVTRNGAILDGWHRYRACTELGISPRCREWCGECGSPLAYVIAKNVERRDLTSGQRAIIAQQAREMVKEEALERQREGAAMTNQKLGRKTDRETLVELVPQASPTGRSREVLAEMFQTNENYVGVAGRVLSDAPDLAEEVMTGAITLKKAERVMRGRKTPSDTSQAARKRPGPAPKVPTIIRSPYGQLVFYWQKADWEERERFRAYIRD